MSLEDEIERLREPAEPEREISLGTATILGIFLLLALLCAGFFGFGYSLGRRSAQAAAAAAAAGAPVPASDAKADSPFTNFKPAPPPAKPVAPPAAESQPSAPAAKAAPDPLQAQMTANEQATSKSNPTAGDGPAIPPGQFVVQVSAPSFEKDAQHLVAVLKQQGYTAFIRKQPGDQFFHVQVGPYATKPEAETARKELEAAGYKLPFIK